MLTWREVRYAKNPGKKVKVEVMKITLKDSIQNTSLLYFSEYYLLLTPGEEHARNWTYL